MDLPGERVARAQQVIREQPRLSVHDAFAFVLAEAHEGCILLSGDEALRALATRSSIEVHGVLWLIDELHRHREVTAAQALNILRDFAADITVRLPRRELSLFLKRYESLVRAPAIP